MSNHWHNATLCEVQTPSAGVDADTVLLDDVSIQTIICGVRHVANAAYTDYVHVSNTAPKHTQ